MVLSSVKGAPMNAVPLPIATAWPKAVAGLGRVHGDDLGAREVHAVRAARDEHHPARGVVVARHPDQQVGVAVGVQVADRRGLSKRNPEVASPAPTEADVRRNDPPLLTRTSTAPAPCTPRTFALGWAITRSDWPSLLRSLGAVDVHAGVGLVEGLGLVEALGLELGLELGLVEPVGEGSAWATGANANDANTAALLAIIGVLMPATIPTPCEQKRRIAPACGTLTRRLHKRRTIGMWRASWQKTSLWCAIARASTR